MNKLNLFLFLIIIVFVGCKQNTNNKAESVSNENFFNDEIIIEKEFDSEKVEENDEICNKFEENMSGGESCIFYGKTIKQAYQIILNKYNEESKHLKKVLPASNIEYKSNVNEENVQITYNYENKSNLFIELSYDGRITEIELREENGNTLSKITYNAD